MNAWQDRLVSATRVTKLGAIARCVLGRNVVDGVRQFHGKASVTSDGFIMCNFVDSEGRAHMGAFVGSVSDLERNVMAVADHLDLTPEDRAAWFAAVRAWIAMDYSGRGLRLD